MKHFWFGILLVVLNLGGASAVTAQGSLPETADWIACKKAPTNICMINTALRIAQASDDASVRTAIGRAQAKAGLKSEAIASFQHALAIAQSPGLEQVRAMMTAGVALGQAEAGLSGEAARTLALAKQYAMASNRRDVELSAIAVIQARMGDIAGANKLAESIGGDDRLSSDALREIVGEYLKAGKTADAARTAQSIVNERIRARSVAAVVGTLAESGNFTEAEQLASTIQNEQFRAAALAEIAKGQIKNGLNGAGKGNFGKALKAARSISGDQLRAETFSDIARAQSSAGLTSDALSTLEEGLAAVKLVTSPQQRTAKSLLILAEADIGRFAEAISLARSIGDNPPVGSMLLYTIAKTEIKMGRTDEAIELVRTIGIPQYQAMALAEIASALPK